jgi:glycolate oxidase FAD binding subunit
MSSPPAATVDLEALRSALPADVKREPADYAIDGAVPALAVRPRSRDELSGTLRAANEADLAVVPQGGRTAIGLGCPLERYDVAIDLTALSRVVEYAPEDLTITVEAGMTLRTLQATLAEHGQYLPVDPAPSDEVTIGGLLATARAGAWRGHLPAARDLILGATIALADGTLTSSGGRVVKNVSGYDLHRLHTGALGSLGVIVAASFKLQPQPSERASLAIDCGSIEVAGQLAIAIWDQSLAARAITVLDPEAAAAIGLHRSGAVLVEFAGVEGAVTRSLSTAVALAREHGAIAESADGASWTRLRALGGGGPDDLVIRAGVPATQVAALVAEAAGHDGPAWGHIAAGAVWARPMRGATSVLKLRGSAEAAGGFLQVESGPRSLRESVDPFDANEVELVRALKAQFDPKRTLNPGRWMAGV